MKLATELLDGISWAERYLSDWDPDGALMDKWPIGELWWRRSMDAYLERARFYEMASYIDGFKRTLELVSMPYKEYLQTEEWDVKRVVALAEAGDRCRVCNEEKGLNVHHRTYLRRGQERKDDLTVLCRDCHSLFHGRKRVAA